MGSLYMDPKAHKQVIARYARAAPHVQSARTILGADGLIFGHLFCTRSRPRCLNWEEIMGFRLYRYAPGRSKARPPSSRCGVSDCSRPLVGMFIGVAAGQEPVCCAWDSVWWGPIEEGAQIGKAQAAPSGVTWGYRRYQIRGIAAQSAREVASARLS
jgi:hypothetical protein